MALTGKQVGQICDALVDAFDEESLTAMVRIELEVKLQAISTGKNLNVIAFNLVSWAEQKGRIGDLIQGAYSQNPGNELVRQLVLDAQTWQTAPQTPPQDAALPTDSAAPGPASVDVFLCYSRKDYAAMHAVYNALHDGGLAVWTDAGLVPGTPNWKDAIEEALDQAKAVVVLLSPNAKGSNWVSNEVTYAMSAGRPVLPMLVGGEPGSAVPIDLINAQWVDGREDPYYTATRSLLPALHAIITGGPVASPPPEPPAPRSRWEVAQPFVAAALVSVGASVAGYVTYLSISTHPRSALVLSVVAPFFPAVWLGMRRQPGRHVWLYAVYCVVAALLCGLCIAAALAAYQVAMQRELRVNAMAIWQLYCLPTLVLSALGVLAGSTWRTLVHGNPGFSPMLDGLAGSTARRFSTEPTAQQQAAKGLRATMRLATVLLAAAGAVLFAWYAIEPFLN